MKNLFLPMMFLALNAQAEIARQVVGDDSKAAVITDLSVNSVIVGSRMQAQKELPVNCMTGSSDSLDCTLRSVPVWAKRLTVTVSYKSFLDGQPCDREYGMNCVGNTERVAEAQIVIPESSVSTDIRASLKKRGNKRIANELFSAKFGSLMTNMSYTVKENCDYSMEGDERNCDVRYEVRPTQVKTIVIDQK